MDMNDTADPSSTKNMPFTLQAVLFTITRMAMNINGRMVYPFMSTFARGLGVDIQAISLALTVRAAIGAGNPIIATFADRHGRKPFILFGLGLTISAAMLVYLVPSYPSFFAYLCLAYLSIYISMPAMQAYVSDLVPYEKRGRVIALMELGWALSFIVGMPLVALLIDRFTWRGPFPFLAGFELLLFLLILFIIPNTAPSAAQSGQSSLSILRAIFTTPAALAALGMNVLFSCSGEMVMLVFGVWMEDSFNMRLAGLGLASAVIGFSELGGEGLSALLVDRLGKKRSIAIGLAVYGLTAFLLPWLGGSVVGALFGLALFYLSFEFAFVSTMPLLSEVLPTARATLMGANVAAISAGRAVAALAAPWVYLHGFRANTLVTLALVPLVFLGLSQVKVAASGSLKRSSESPQ
jgi:MFS transporter, DHA1 family, inner membrane transport protein